MTPTADPVREDADVSESVNEMRVRDDSDQIIGKIKLGPNGLTYFRGMQRLPHLALSPQETMELLETHSSRNRARQLRQPYRPEEMLMGVFATSLNPAETFFRWTGLKTPALDHCQLSNGTLDLPPNPRRGGTYLQIRLHIRLAIWMISAYISGPLARLPMTPNETEEAPVSKHEMRKQVISWMDQLEGH